MSRSHKELLDAGIRSGHEYLDSFRELRPGWDGHGAEPIHSKSIELAHRIMDVIGDDKFTCPDNEGGVMFEWDVDDNGSHIGVSSREASGTYIVSVMYLSETPSTPLSDKEGGSH